MVDRWPEPEPCSLPAAADRRGAQDAGDFEDAVRTLWPDAHRRAEVEAVTECLIEVLGDERLHRLFHGRQAALGVARLADDVNWPNIIAGWLPGVAR